MQKLHNITTQVETGIGANIKHTTRCGNEGIKTEDKGEDVLCIYRSQYRPLLFARIYRLIVFSHDRVVPTMQYTGPVH